jgi:hypothetical protein
MQPDVAKKDFGMKIFTDNKKYKAYDFDLLRKSTGKGKNKKPGKTKTEIYALHGEILKKILSEGDGIQRLADLDDRFNPSECIKKALIQLEKNYHIGREKEKDLEGLKSFSENNAVNREQMYAINAYNK